MGKGLNSCWWGLACALALLLVAAVLWVQMKGPNARPTLTLEPVAGEAHPESETHQGFLYGRVTTVEGVIYEGRLRWGGDEEAFWGDQFNGSKVENTWAAQVPPERLPKGRSPIKIFGARIADRESSIDLDRPFMARFGDIARIEVSAADVRVTLKSGTVFDLDRFAAGDFDDAVRVWDVERGVVDLDSRRVRTVELLPTPSLGPAPYRLHGIVRTRQGEFTGFVQWNREECVAPDTLDGRSADGDLSVRFGSIRSVTRRSSDSSLITLLDGWEIVLSDTRDVGEGNRGLYVDDRRYGRVLVSWDAFVSVEFNSAGSGPAYEDFPPARPLTGSVTTRNGDRLDGRLVFDLDESETVETLDAPIGGVDYIIPFGLIAKIVRGRDGFDSVTLHDGEALNLEHAGDLGEGNAGMLVFVEGRESPDYVPWTEVQEIEFGR